MADTYYTTETTFDVNKFNQTFDDYLAKEKSKRIVTEQKYLEAKDIVKKEKLIHEYTFYELIVNMKNAIFDILGEVVANDVTIDTFTKNNRTFYLGLLLLIFATTLIGINIIFT
jgi:hypothetical protein